MADELMKIAKFLDPEAELDESDIKSTPMGVNGVDVQLSTGARKLVNFDIECKNVERPNFWGFIDQTIAASIKGKPMLISKKNGSDVWITLKWSDFKELAYGIKEEF
jgi:hypothetical protein